VQAADLNRDFGHVGHQLLQIKFIARQAEPQLPQDQTFWRRAANYIFF
jgi:hypothetical protein